MRCDDVSPLLIDQRLERRPLPPEAAAHLRTCPRCAEEAVAVATLWDDLRAVISTSAPGNSRDVLLPHLRGAVRRMDRRARMKSTASLAAGVLLVALASGFAGFTLGERTGATPEVTAATAAEKTQFLLLLHESPQQPARSDRELAAIVDEYRQWARRLAAAGRLAAAEKLRDDGGRWVETTPGVRTDDVVSGFFLIHARDYDDALRIARDSPHVRYGGRIEIRAIERT
jgi:hypothetical protein